MRETAADKLFSIVSNGAIMLLSLTCIMPFLYVISVSITTSQAFYLEGARLIPNDVTFAAYRSLLVDATLFRRALANTLLLTAMGTSVTVFLSTMTGYAFSKRDVPGRKLILIFLYLSGFFAGGLIPKFFVLQRMGLINTYWALIIPTAAVFNYLLIKNYFIMALPAAIEESAKLDGASTFQVLIRIVMPLALPIMATIALFSAVMFWNTYMEAVLFVPSRKKMVVMRLLQSMIEVYSGDFAEQLGRSVDMSDAPSEGFKMAALFIATVPILFLYPFLQKHFAKGIIIGAVKG